MSSDREFSFPDFERITVGLTGAERLAVFLGLPVDLQNEAWRELSERVGRDSRARFAESRLDDGRAPQELASEIEAVWDECRKVPLGWVGPTRAEGLDGTRTVPGAARSKRGAPCTPRAGTDIDLRRTIASVVFVPRLTGPEVTRAGFVRCPFHAGGEERTGSLHVSSDQRWYCHACHAGGGLIDFYALLRGRPVPAGGEFLEFVRDLAIELGGAA